MRRGDPGVSWLPLLCQQLYKLRIENKPPANARHRHPLSFTIAVYIWCCLPRMAINQSINHSEDRVSISIYITPYSARSGSNKGNHLWYLICYGTLGVGRKLNIEGDLRSLKRRQEAFL